MARLKLTLAYQGAGFHGWQAQEGEAPLRTVQVELERAAARLLGRPDDLFRAHGAGRTDAGVHAAGQVAHLDVPAAKAGLPWRRALNALLPRDMAVVRAEIVDEDFHARFSAQSKIYSYSLWLEPEYVSPHRRPYVWPAGRLDLDRLDAACSLFEGEHDFAAFQNVGTPVRSTVRSMFSVSRRPGLHPCETVLFFHADGFLKQMARNIVGCLVEIAKGKLAIEGARALLTGGRRSQAPATAPARGLCLERVFYPGEEAEASLLLGAGACAPVASGADATDAKPHHARPLSPRMRGPGGSAPWRGESREGAQPSLAAGGQAPTGASLQTAPGSGRDEADDLDDGRRTP